MNKRRRTMIDSSVPAILFRELGDLSARNFSHRLAASEDRVLRFEIDRKLEKHRGCVNTIAFNEDGDILISGSDDRHIILWDWVTGISKLAFHSGHHNNVFHAKFMPYTNDKSIVSCAADGQVRYSEVLEGGDVKTSLLAKHQGGAHKLAIEPGSPHVFYSCGEDGVVQHFDLRTRAATELFTCHQGHARSRYSQMIQLNTITIDPRNANLFAVAGSDEYARLYDIRKYYSNGPSEFDQPVDYFCPPHLIGDRVGITGLAYSDHSELLASYNDESIYLFERGMGLGPSQVAHPSGSKRKGVKGGTSSGSSSVSHEDVAPQVYKGHRNRETVKGVGFFGPRCEYVVSGSDCGRIFIWKKKGGRLVRVMEADKDIVNCVESHPHIPVLASSGIESDVKIWTPTAIKKAVLPKKIDEVRPKARSWMYHVSPEDLLLQLFSSLQRRRADPDHDGGDEANSTSGRELMELIRAYNLNNNNSSDDDDDDDDGDASGPEDFFS